MTFFPFYTCNRYSILFLLIIFSHGLYARYSHGTTQFSDFTGNGRHHNKEIVRSCYGAGTPGTGVLNDALLIHQNPIKDTVIIEYTLNKQEAITIQLLDLQEKILATFIDRQVQPAGKRRQPLVLPEGLLPGEYVIALSNGKGSLGFKVIQ